MRTAYNQWTQFEKFPPFMEGVKEVNQLDSTRLHWKAAIAGHEKEWNAEITEQAPDQRIPLTSRGGPLNGGVVTFQRGAIQGIHRETWPRDRCMVNDQNQDN